MDKFIGIFRRQPVYSAFLSTLVVASLVIAYVMFISHDTQVYYFDSQVKGVTVSRPEKPENIEPQTVTSGTVVYGRSRSDDSDDSGEVTESTVLVVVKTSIPTTTKKRKEVTTTTKKSKDVDVTTTTTEPTTTESQP